MPAAARRCIGPLALIFLVSCATAPRTAPPAKTIEGVPFYAQIAFQCGPASLAGVLNFWGADVTPDEIAGDIYSPTAKGTLNIDMALYARKLGFQARQYSGSIADIRANIDAGHPVIVLVDLGRWLYRQDHYMVVVGYHDGGLIVNSGKEEKKFLPLKDFMRSWEKAGSWTLLVKPE